MGLTVTELAVQHKRFTAYNVFLWQLSQFPPVDELIFYYSVDLAYSGFRQLSARFHNSPDFERIRVAHLVSNRNQLLTDNDSQVLLNRSCFSRSKRSKLLEIFWVTSLEVSIQEAQAASMMELLHPPFLLCCSQLAKINDRVNHSLSVCVRRFTKCCGSKRPRLARFFSSSVLLLSVFWWFLVTGRPTVGGIGMVWHLSPTVHKGRVGQHKCWETAGWIVKLGPS